MVALSGIGINAVVLREGPQCLRHSTFKGGVRSEYAGRVRSRAANLAVQHHDALGNGAEPGQHAGAERVVLQQLRLQVQTNPHSPRQFRVNGVVQNMPEFGKAFGCKTGQPMMPANACRVW